MKQSSSLRPIEYVVLVGTIAFALMVTAAICGNSRTYAEQAECMSKLCKWAAVIHAINGSRDGELPLLRPEMALYPNLLKCPSTHDDPNRPADKPDLGGTTTTFQFVDDANRVDTASYGFNNWIMSSPYPPRQERANEPNHIDDYRYPSSVPLMLDSRWLEGWPMSIDFPPVSPDFKYGPWNEMRIFVMDRHSGGVHCLFLDDSVRRVEVHDLWQLRWYNGFDIQGPWTPSGGIRPEDWPEWLRPPTPEPPEPPVSDNEPNRDRGS